jgi:hypothetical protein
MKRGQSLNENWAGSGRIVSPLLGESSVKAQFLTSAGRILAELALNPAVSLAELSEKTKQPRKLVVDVISQLEASGYVHNERLGSGIKYTVQAEPAARDFFPVRLWQAGLSKKGPDGEFSKSRHELHHWKSLTQNEVPLWAAMNGLLLGNMVTVCSECSACRIGEGNAATIIHPSKRDLEAGLSKEKD